MQLPFLKDCETRLVFRMKDYDISAARRIIRHESKPSDDKRASQTTSCMNLFDDKRAVQTTDCKESHAKQLNYKHCAVLT